MVNYFASPEGENDDDGMGNMMTASVDDKAAFSEFLQRLEKK